MCDKLNFIEDKTLNFFYHQYHIFHNQKHVFSFQWSDNRYKQSKCLIKKTRTFNFKIRQKNNRA